MEKLVKFEELKGKVLTEISDYESDYRCMTFRCSDGSVYRMYHEQDCCESVYIEDVCGEVENLIGSEILMAEEESNIDEKPLSDWDESYTWTYYKLATLKGYVTIRWYGSSNGYYSESVEFYKVK